MVRPQIYLKTEKQKQSRFNLEKMNIFLFKNHGKVTELRFEQS